MMQPPPLPDLPQATEVAAALRYWEGEARSGEPHHAAYAQRRVTACRALLDTMGATIAPSRLA